MSVSRCEFARARGEFAFSLFLMVRVRIDRVRSCAVGVPLTVPAQQAALASSHGSHSSFASGPLPHQLIARNSAESSSSRRRSSQDNGGVNEQWVERLALCRQYMKKQKRKDVPRDALFRDFQVGYWYHMQWYAYENNALTRAQSRQLFALGVPFAANYLSSDFGESGSEEEEEEEAEYSEEEEEESQSDHGSPSASQKLSRKQSMEERWQRAYGAYRDYCRRHRVEEVRSSILYRGINLGRWARTQRARMANGLIPRDKVERLSKIGLYPPSQSAESHSGSATRRDSDTSTAFDRKWDEKFNLFAEYCNKHNVVSIPRGVEVDGVQLGIWYETQRRRAGLAA